MSMTPAESKAALDAIAVQVNACTACGLHKNRTRAVPGAGPANADLMFIGEGPGFHEDQKGLPFVGQSGKLLETLLGKIGLNRDQVFIGNVVKCRPPENRDPLPDEVTTCTEAYLFKQIEALQPKVIVTLGRFSMGLFFPKAKITAIHGQAKWENGRYYLPLFHPAAVLRNMAIMPQMEDDFQKIPTLVKDYTARLAKASGGGGGSETAAQAGEEKPAEDSPTQLTLF
ncbi:MAG TPA: uracil-DNA glycosylase [Aggregatilineales bacterium]|nr:uracil-DNA glycosylase [Aggregatilineales bacterium]